MTQAINLANFANNLDSSGGVNPSALNAAVPISKGGTAATTASGARTSLDVPSTSGSGATGTWAIDISGNADTATNADHATTADSATNADHATNADYATIAGNGGVTSVNGVTGAVVTTGFNAVGSCAFLVYAGSTNLFNGDTASGTLLYYPTAAYQDGSYGWFTAGNGNSFPSTRLGQLAGNGTVTGMQVTYSSNSGFQNPLGTVATASGTWRYVGGFIQGKVYSYEAPFGTTQYQAGLFIKVSS
jgi:hypothetical protein